MISNSSQTERVDQINNKHDKWEKMETFIENDSEDTLPMTPISTVCSGDIYR